MVERADRAPVGTFHVPGAWSAVVELDDAAAHHAQVKRLREGDVVRLTSGAGHRATGVLASLGKRRATVEIDPAEIETVAPPPHVALLAPVGDRERMLLLAEKCVELGLSAWHPVVHVRSRSVSPRGEGEQFREKVRLRMISALEQSGGAWLPMLHREVAGGEAASAFASSHCLLLDAAGGPIVDRLPSVAAPVAIALGPEGGLDDDERAAFVQQGWHPVSLGANVLRFETAGIAALAVLRAFPWCIP